MQNKGKILLSVLAVSVFFFTGCAVFSGQYETPRFYEADDTKESVSFEEGAKSLEEKLDDMARGIQREEATSSPSQNPNNQAINQENTQTMPVLIQPGKNYSAVLHTEEGDIEIELFADKTPVTVNNFVLLSKKDFYNNTIFHRVIKGFMIQGGDPRGDGTGGPGYAFDDEPFTGEYNRGTIAMANSGPNTNGSQFFIMHQDYPLQKNYVIFGKVTKGLDVVDKIAEAPVEQSFSGEASKPLNPTKIKTVDIIEK